MALITKGYHVVSSGVCPWTAPHWKSVRVIDIKPISPLVVCKEQGGVEAERTLLSHDWWALFNIIPELPIAIGRGNPGLHGDHYMVMNSTADWMLLCSVISLCSSAPTLLCVSCRDWHLNVTSEKIRSGFGSAVSRHVFTSFRNIRSGVSSRCFRNSEHVIFSFWNVVQSVLLVSKCKASKCSGKLTK